MLFVLNYIIVSDLFVNSRLSGSRRIVFSSFPSTDQFGSQPSGGLAVFVVFHFHSFEKKKVI